MPEISRFYGIVIKMFFDDHQPPHFHAEYAEFEALIDNHSAFSVRGFTTSEGVRNGHRMDFVTSGRVVACVGGYEKSKTSQKDSSLAVI
jgi:hypothetical protein